MTYQPSPLPTFHSPPAPYTHPSSFLFLCFANGLVLTITSLLHPEGFFRLKEGWKEKVDVENEADV